MCIGNGHHANKHLQISFHHYSIFIILHVRIKYTPDTVLSYDHTIGIDVSKSIIILCSLDVSLMLNCPFGPV